MSYAVLPALLVALVVGELLADELVDLGQGEPLHGRALDGHADQRHVRVGRLLQVGLLLLLWLKEAAGAWGLWLESSSLASESLTAWVWMWSWWAALRRLRAGADGSSSLPLLAFRWCIPLVVDCIFICLLGIIEVLCGLVLLSFIYLNRKRKKQHE